MAAPVKLLIGEINPPYQLQLLDGYGNPPDLTGATVSFQFRPKDSQTFTINSSANVTILDATNAEVSYEWQAGDSDVAGIYQARWSVLYPGETVPLVYPSDVGDAVLITSGPNLGWNSGPCTPWTNVAAVRACCSIEQDPESADYVADDIIQEQIDVAGDALFQLSGRIYSGECLTAIRPQTGDSCFGRYTNGWYVANYSSSWNWSDSWPSWGCDCNGASRLRLGHYPVTNIVTVTIDGVILDPSEYRLDEFRWLRRMDGGSWPQCQRLDLPATEVGTFEVLMEHGATVPPLGAQAARDLACQLTQDCAGGDCGLPSNTVTAVRQGVTITMQEKRDLLTVPAVSLFLSAHNPGGLKRRPSVLSPDWP